jgi:hypothetical protein
VVFNPSPPLEPKERLLQRETNEAGLAETETATSETKGFEPDWLEQDERGGVATRRLLLKGKQSMNNNHEQAMLLPL